jgi:hypothetical protein
MLLALPAAELESSVKIEAPYPGAIGSKPLAIGPTWVAFFQDTGSTPSSERVQIAVMDTATRQLLRTIPGPVNRTPIPGLTNWFRTVTQFGVKAVTDGTHLLTLSQSTIEQLAADSSLIQKKFNYTLHAWNIPGGEFIGAVDIDEYPSDPGAFIGIGDGRIAYVRAGVRNIRLWDAATFAPLPTIAIPDGTPALTSSVTSGPIAMAGSDLVYQATDAQSIQQLFHVNLTTGAITKLPKPAGYETGAFQYLATGGGYLLAPSSYAGSTIFHYDLATAQIVAQTDGGNQAAQPYFAPDGSWLALSIGTNGAPDRLRSGPSGAIAGSAVFQLPDPGYGSNYYDRSSYDSRSYSQGYLWMRKGIDADGTVCSRLPVTPQPIAYVTGRALPARESDGSLKTVFTLSRPLDHAITLRVRTLTGIGSATAGSDYEAYDGDVIVPANATQAILPLPLIQDNLIEENETLVLEIASAPADILIVGKEIPAIITGSSFHRLPPIAAWQDTTTTTPRVDPYTIALAGNRLIQTNKYGYGPVGDAPRVLTRPLDGGEWTPSVSLASIPPDDNRILTNEAGLAIITNRRAIHLYDSVTDAVSFERPDDITLSSSVTLGETHFLIDSSEYPLTPPILGRSPIEPSIYKLGSTAAYTTDYLIGGFTGLYGGLHKVTRTTRTDAGQLAPGAGWNPSIITASGNLFAGGGYNAVWFGRADQPGRIIPVRTANGPLVNVTGIRISGTRILATDAPSGKPPTIRIFDTPSGLEIGSLLAEPGIDLSNIDFSPYLPAGISPWTGDPLGAANYELNNFSIGGKNIVATIRWPDLFQTNLVAARFVQETGLPGIIDPAPIREDAAALPLSLTEAAPFPITVTTRAIAALHNDDAVWTDSGSTIVIPAGTTAFATTMVPFNDRLPEGTVAAPLEITLTGNGLTRTIRTAVQVLDDDQLPLAAVPNSSENFGLNFTPVAGGWAYLDQTMEDNLLTWTGNDLFTQGSPFGAYGNRAFATDMAGTGDWLAVTHDAFLGLKNAAKPSQIQIYQPATRGKTPARVIKGMKSNNNFGHALFARDTTLWVGAPGSIVIAPKYKKTDGQVLQYDLPTGKKTRTFKAPKTHAVGFGSSIAANNTSVWIGSTASGGALFQYSRAKGKLLRTISKPAGGEEAQYFARTIAANSNTIVADSSLNGWFPVTLRGYAEATGALLWDLSPPAGRRFASFTFITDDILATGGDSLIFWHLTPGGPPELLTEVLIPREDTGPNATLYITKLAAANGQLALLYSEDALHYKTTLLTLDGIDKLGPYLPAAPATPASLTEATTRSATHTLTGDDNSNSLTTASGITPPAVLTLGQTTTGDWQLQLPSAAQAAATSTTLEFSTDLSTWQLLATPTADGTTWQLAPATNTATGETCIPLEGAPLEGTALIDGTTLQVPRDLPRLFFRLHTP